MMKKFSFLFLVFFFLFKLGTSRAEEIKFISQTEDSSFYQTLSWQSGNPYRPVIVLDGEWEYRISEKSPWKKVTIPASCDYRGEITFQRFFSVDSTWKDYFFRLVCYGINYYCEIFINDKFVGSHSGGYSSFFINVVEDVIYFHQKNIIEIKVDTRLDQKNTIPLRFQPYGVKNTAGIFRSLFLLALPELSIENVTVDYQLNTDFTACELTIDLDIKDRINDFTEHTAKKATTPRLKYQIDLLEKETGKRVLWRRKKIDYASYRISTPLSEKLILRRPRLWSPEDPSLYVLQIKLLQGKRIIDQYDSVIGIKQLDLFNGNIYLNGELYFLKGINWVEDYLVGGALFDREQLLKDLELVKQLNANAIRVVDHPPHPFLVAACDSLGLFLFEELPLISVTSSRLKSDVFIARAKNYLSEIVRRDQSHVSLFAVGIGGDFLLTDVSSLYDIEKIYQPLALATSIPFYTYSTPKLTTYYNYPGIISGLSLFGLEKKSIASALPIWLRQIKNKPSIVFSFGAAKYGTAETVEEDVVFQKHQVLQIVNAWQMMNRHHDLDGYFITALSDYRGNYPTAVFGNSDDFSIYPIGLTDYNRVKRYSFETIKSLYREGEARYSPGVKLETNQEEIFLFSGLLMLLLLLVTINNRRYFRENFKRIFIHPHGFYTDLRDGRKIPVLHTSLIALFVSFGYGLVLASLIYFFKDYWQFDHILTLLVPQHGWKDFLCKVIWQPALLILVLSLLIAMIFALLSVMLKVIALLEKRRLPFTRALTLTFWLGGNFVIFIPLGMLLFRVLQYSHLMGMTLLALIIINVWFFVRFVKGIRVLFSWTLLRSFVVITVVHSMVIFIILYFYQANYALLDYVRFYYLIYGPKIFFGLY